MPPPARGFAATEDRLAWFLEAVGEGLGEVDEERIAQGLFQRLLQASGARAGCLILDDLFEKPRIAASRGVFAADPGPLPARLTARLPGLYGAGGAVEEAADDPWSSVRGGPRAGGGLWVPVPARERPIGVAWLEDFEAGALPAEPERRFFEALARHLGVAIGTARLHQEHEKKKNRIEKLNKVLETKIQTQTIKIQQMATELATSRREFQLKYDYDRIVGKSPKMREIFEILDKVIESDLPVLVQGESGTGKELIAKAIHYNGTRKDGPFVSENCAAIGESLFESELFGYERGAFTGAEETKPGLFEVADGGTLFLDEVGDLDLENQKKLLRALQEGEIRRVGGKTPIPVDVRVISATNRPLEEMIAEKEFREDLYYRLKVVSIKLPPLRERVEDIPLLIDHFLAEVAAEQGKPPIQLSPDTVRAFLTYSWPGNIRELENEVRRLVILGEREFKPGATTSVRRFQGAGPMLPAGLGLEEAIAHYERELILGALEANGWNKSKAARDLKIGRMKLHRKMEKLGLESGED